MAMSPPKHRPALLTAPLLLAIEPAERMRLGTPPHEEKPGVDGVDLGVRTFHEVLLQVPRTFRTLTAMSASPWANVTAAPLWD